MIDLSVIKSMSRNRVRDYVIPGLTSSLIGGEGHGMVRMFSQERKHEEPITPHSHRFDFSCLVLAGSVINRIWEKVPGGDLYQCSVLEHHGNFGDQTRSVSTEVAGWDYVQESYSEGMWYHMKHDQIHSIFFSRGAEVLFFEGPSKGTTSVVLEPMSGGEVIPTFKVESWMFKKE